MTALLTADEAARLTLGVNVIVRPGDQLVQVVLQPFTVVAPQEWVALTGPCPCVKLTGKQGWTLAPGIEVVPVVDGWGHPPSLDESPKCLVFAPPYAILELVKDYMPMILAFGDRRLNLPVFDPLPVPARDFGIVIDVTELA